MRSELLSSQHWKCSSQRVVNVGHTHGLPARPAACFCFMCAVWYSLSLLPLPLELYSERCFHKFSIPFVLQCLFFVEMQQCSFCHNSSKRLWQLDYLQELDIECGILLLERWFPKVFLRPQVNGLTQDELLVSNNLLITAHRKRLKLVCSTGW